VPADIIFGGEPQQRRIWREKDTKNFRQKGRNIFNKTSTKARINKQEKNKNCAALMYSKLHKRLD
jgi:hypothetical protein